jgi:hypothetical protein
MITAKIKKLEAAKAKIAAKIAVLEKKMSAYRAKQLAALPAKHGFESLADFIKALKGASGGKGKSSKAAGGKKRRKRAVITAATRAEVKKLVEAGKTGAAIAKSVGISLPSVQNIKKALGLVQARKK